MKRLLPLLMLFFACKKSSTQTETPPAPGYESAPQAIALTGTKVKEASGITYSKVNKNKLWVEQDSGNPPLLYLLQNDGAITDSVLLDGATNRDWEDVVTGNGPANGKSFLYVGDIGDNNQQYDEYYIYRFEEPAEGVKQVIVFDKIRFTYADGKHDAEALLVDNTTSDIFIITKRDAKSRVYRLAYPQNTTSVNVAQFVSELTYSGVVSACLSPANDEIIIKTYTDLYHYTSKPGEGVAAALAAAPEQLDYQMEAQGEAACFAADGSGFYTLSEEALGVVPTLNFYKRKSSNP